jgi:hypothetical protein
MALPTKKKRGLRAWVKVHLSDSAESHEAGRTVEDWKTWRQATHHLVRAILIYAALLRGDTGPLEKHFPGLGRAYRPLPYPQVAAPGRAVATITMTQVSDEEQLADALDIGLGGLEF